MYLLLRTTTDTLMVFTYDTNKIITKRWCADPTCQVWAYQALSP